MKIIFLNLLISVAFTACANPYLQLVPIADTRTDTTQSPYRTIPPYIECSDCIDGKSNKF